MSLIQAHRAVLRQNIARTRVAAPARGAHGEYRHMPFKHPATDATSKGSMAVKTGVFLTVGMSIPVGMSFYQLRKQGGAA
ncbi:uncharacterized protein STEHIDRAFT_137336 [Stereum hirsutum FP-91666 SS1]|uniref:uncharacterized protein n=1 Tax=Stereum hirsutum (strain FP-91666) TaxID=721885 RepID=UPI000440F93C|nr:uncharacterized protein STEHIDRAFT_137336 [Stereum hirsutum FP-91666 SS1]EIM89592.1 hypothetical protein STEHIDRAFT_137336 [Stereum hirsutum FP-91666 SS1]